jgi:hypothetical protein
MLETLEKIALEKLIGEVTDVVGKALKDVGKKRRSV